MICFSHSIEDLMPIVSIAESGAYVLRLPRFLQADQIELEQMLNKLFAGHLTLPCNLALAQQLSLNWCASKAKKSGLSKECVCRR